MRLNSLLGRKNQCHTDIRGGFKKRGSKMKLFDEKFRTNKVRYIAQCILVTISVLIVLLLLDAIADVVIIAALGASFFIAFTMPDKQLSNPRFLIGGYLVGIVVGSLCHYLSLVPLLTQIPVIQKASYTVFCALSVGLAIFVMVVTDTEHPPAASFALGLVLNFNHMAIIVALIGIISLSIIRAVLRPTLVDLV
jgi:CBS-domain-containing membrane protein